MTEPILQMEHKLEANNVMQNLHFFFFFPKENFSAFLNTVFFPPRYLHTNNEGKSISETKIKRVPNLTHTYSLDLPVQM